MSETTEYDIYLAWKCVMDVFYVFCNIHKNVFQNPKDFFQTLDNIKNYLSD